MNNVRPVVFSKREWLVFWGLAAVAAAAWFRFAYPQFTAIDLSVNKQQAVRCAQDFLMRRGVEHRKYTLNAVFESNEWPDTYLQKTLGLERGEAFARDNGCELFCWRVRFFRQFEKEEYSFAVSPRTGKIISFEHGIPDIEARETLTKEDAAAKAAAFLKENGLDLSGYDFHEEKAKKFDRRTDYTFLWEKKGAYIPWKEGQGGAKLITGVSVAGSEISTYYINQFDLPENFYRDIERQLLFGDYISTFSRLLFALFIIFSLIVLVGKRANVQMRFIRNRVLIAAAVLAGVYFLSVVNDLQNVLASYPTSTSIASYLGIYLLQSLMGVFFLGVIFAAPALAGESLQAEVVPSAGGRSLSHYMLSSFFTRSAARLVASGYLLFIILLGAQAVIFFFGQRYLGVWKQWIKLTQFSSAYLPFYSAFAVGVTASLTEEAVFRLFGINWGRRVFRSSVAAVLFTSIAWGFGHTQYAIFPVWFRGIEVSLIGLLYGFIFLRYGIIPLITAHYLFDVFWGVSPFILGKSTPYLFYGSALVLLLPLAYAAAAFIMNRNEEERKIKFLLDPAQEFNLGVLKAFVIQQRAAGAPAPAVRAELLRHNWDSALIELAIREIYGEGHP